ncbi:COG4223 family protein [Hoeflea sp.]|uniref:COG4223 family protein n=1 Tax=Hoeflea sp. TaxID=1940281 RepID=UPI003749F710
MSKGPTPRHSKSPKPLTIDLDAKDVTPQSASGAETKPATGKPKPAGKPAETAPSKSSSSTPKVSAAAATKPATKTETATDKKPAGSGVKPASIDVGTSTTAKSGPSTSVAEGNASKSTPDQAQAQGEAQAKTQARAETKRSESKPTQPAPSKRGGGLGMVASGLIGAIIALGGGYGLQTTGLLPAPGVSPDSADQLQSLASRVDGLAGTVNQLSADLSALPSDGDSGLTTELQARLASLEAAIAGGAAAPGDGGTVDLAPLNARLDALEANVAALGESDANASADPELAAAVTELKAGQSGVNAAVSELQSQSAALSDSVAGLEQRQDTLEARLDEPSRQIDLARAIAAAGLKTAIDRGGPFMSELEAFASVAPDDPAVPEFRDLAASGVPSRSDLMEAFPDAANQAIAAANPIDPDAGLVDRLMSSALSVVKVRPVGEVEGDTAEAIVARTEARLLDGNLDAALSEWNTLPEAALAATSDFGDSLAARARAEKLIASSLTSGSSAAAPTPESSQAPAN